MADEQCTSLDNGLSVKHPTNRINIEVFREALDKAEADYLAACKKLASLERVVFVANLARQSASKAYRNALEMQTKAHHPARIHLNQRKPKKAQSIALGAEPPKCIGSMVAMLLHGLPAKHANSTTC